MDDDSAWRNALASLREAPPPAEALEERVMSALAARRITPRPGVSRLRLVLAALFLLALGGAAGRWAIPEPGQPSGSRYLLLLYEGERYDSSGTSHESRVAEYRAWSRELGRVGRLVDGAELGTDGTLLGGDGESTVAPAGIVAGYFIIRAEDEREAAAIAAGCPHLKYGGVVQVRPLRTS